MRDSTGGRHTDYDLIVIGTGAEGRAAAVRASEAGRRPAVVMPHADAVPYRLGVWALRAAAHEGPAAAGRPAAGITDLAWRARRVAHDRAAALQDELRRHRVTVLTGAATFRDAHTVSVDDGHAVRTTAGAAFVIATGSRPGRPDWAGFDGRSVLDPVELLTRRRVPASLVVVGAGADGMEAASALADLGCRITVVDARTRLLDPVDDEVSRRLEHHLRGRGWRVRLGTPAHGVVPSRDGARVRLDGATVAAEAALVAVGRVGETAGLDLPRAGVRVDATGRVVVGADGRSSAPHIRAVGDVARGPARAAADPGEGLEPPAVYAVYTRPEVAGVGPTERDLIAAGVPHVVGRAGYRELVRGGVDGDGDGLVKVIASAGSGRLLAVHIVGSCACELVHAGLLALTAGLDLGDLVEAGVPGPSFADGYRVAAADALARISRRRPAWPGRPGTRPAVHGAR